MHSFPNILFKVFQFHHNRGSHTFSREPDFSERMRKNEKVGREKGSQWGVPAHGGCVTPCFDVVSMENENWRMGLQACTRLNVSSQHLFTATTMQNTQ